MKYIVIGLGNYGGILAEELTVLGHEVIGVDVKEHHVERLKDKIATAFVLDATDEMALSVLPLKSVDVVLSHWRRSGSFRAGGFAVEEKQGEAHLRPGAR